MMMFRFVIQSFTYPVEIRPAQKSKYFNCELSWKEEKPQGPRYDFENGGGHIREAARFTITLGANKISNVKGKWLGNDETIYYFEW